jgi:hypothetical protein
VNHPREQLFAGSALPQDQHRRRRPRHLDRTLHDLLRGAARPDDELAGVVLGDLGVQPDDGAAEILALAGIGHERSQSLGVEVLGDVMVGAVPHRLDRGVELLDRRHDDHLDVGKVLLEDPQHLQPADAGKVHVEEHQIDVFLLRDLEGGLPGRHAQDAIVLAEDGGHGVAHPLVVVDDEERLAALGHAVGEYTK